MTATGFIRARSGERRPDGEGLWFVFAGPNVLVQEGQDRVALPRARLSEELDMDVLEPIYMGRLDGVSCVAARLPDEQIPHGYVARDLRGLYGLVAEPVWVTAGVAFQLVQWTANTRYCPRTGQPTRLKAGEWAMECPSCDLLQYPPLHPCVIVLVHDGDRILLTRQSSWPPGRYGLVAGFVEPGETLEQCLAREVREETDLAVDDIRYFASQPWPFPHQLMCGFTARYAGGQITIDTTELEDASWFQIDALPILPAPLSIARRIIDAHVAAYKQSL